MSGDSSILDWVQPHLLEMSGYVPVEPPEFLAGRLGLPVEGIVKLDANESPYPPSPKVLEALAGLKSLGTYPDPRQRRLRSALAEYVGLSEDYVVAGAGSDELIDLVTRMFVAPGEAVLVFPPTFGMYAFSAEVQGARVIGLPRLSDFSLDLDGLAREASGARLVCAVSPNNPTGNLLTSRELDALLATGRPVVVDEAYFEFAGQSFTALVAERPNLIILRTFSKWAGLAGLRVGFMVAAPEVVEVVLKAKQPYSVSVAAEAAALAALDDRDYLMRTVEAVVAERERLASLLRTLESVTVWPSMANFLLCRLEGHDAKDVHGRLLERGIMVRHYNTPLLRNSLRISVGRTEHSDRLLEALREVLAASGAGARP